MFRLKSSIFRSSVESFFTEKINLPTLLNHLSIEILRHMLNFVISFDHIKIHCQQICTLDHNQTTTTTWPPALSLFSWGIWKNGSIFHLLQTSSRNSHPHSTTHLGQNPACFPRARFARQTLTERDVLRPAHPYRLVDKLVLRPSTLLDGFRTRLERSSLCSHTHANGEGFYAHVLCSRAHSPPRKYRWHDSFDGVGFSTTQLIGWVVCGCVREWGVVSFVSLFSFVFAYGSLVCGGGE